MLLRLALFGGCFFTRARSTRKSSGIFDVMKFRAICENHLYIKAYSKGKRALTPALAVYVLPDYAAGRLAKADPERRVMNRYGLTVSAKVGCAVVRSRVRRILREGLRSLERDLPVKQGYLVVIAARSAAIPLKSYDIRRQLEVAFRQVNMLKKESAENPSPSKD